MTSSPLARLALVLALVPLSACGGGGDGDSDTDGAGSCVAGLRGGELVISEFLADPEGADADRIEWFEIYNPGDAPIPLEGIGLVYSKFDGSDPEGHLIVGGGREIAPKQYMTFGSVVEDARPPYIDYGYGGDLGSMSNSQGSLSIRCGSVVVDEIKYPTTVVKSGVSAIFGGQHELDAESNDDFSRWCTSPTDGEAYIAGEYGSPRAANPACPLPEPATCAQCWDGEILRDVVAPEPGQLVITEIMANASTATDMTVGEWFEVKVTGGTFDLNCLQYGNSVDKFLVDPATAKVVKQPTCFTVTEGDVLLFSEVAWDETDVVSGISFNDGPTTANPNPGVYIAYADEILDEVHYPKAKDGVAWSLDPQWTSVDGNDDPAHFCDAYTPFAGGDLGTPGADNPPCLQHACDDGGVMREASAPAPGDILITEVHANASNAIGEPAGEWIELFSAVPFDLNGVQLGKAPGEVSFTFSGNQCLPVGPGYVLLARDGAPGMMLEPDALYGSLQLSNTNGALWIGIGGDELDYMPYETPADGVARQVDPTVIDTFMMTADPTLNDPVSARCDATLAYPPFATDLGTPGAPNTMCPPPAGTCLDPDTMELRPVDPPAVGEILITEFMANPKQVTDAAGEWFELYADADFDLNGLELGKVWEPYTVAETIPGSGTCIEVKAGQYVIIARGADPAQNGGLPEPVYVTKISLGNTSGGIFVGHGGVVLDSVPYTTVTEGRATQLGAEFITPGMLDPAVNDIELNFCAAGPLYNDVDAGTPAAPNPPCDDGFDDPCFDVAMNAMREKKNPAPGDLILTEFLANPSGTETDREWFEILATADVDLNNVKALNKFAPTVDEIGAAKAFGGTDCIFVPAGARALIARKADPNINGGLPPVDATFGFALANNAGALAIAVGDQVLDAIQWNGAQSEDISRQLDPGVVDPDLNDDAGALPWCPGTPSTPKEENLACP